MESLYESIKQGISEAIEYERGNLPNIKVDRISISPLILYSGNRVKKIRKQHNMTQRLFAEALGVSVKTIEAWESNKNTPSGCASRILELIERDKALLEKHSIIMRK